MSLEVNIQKSIGSFRLDVSFEVKDGEILGLLGESGCGKSMTLKCIAGIETPDCGRIVLDNRILFDSNQKINLPPQKRRVGYLFQDYALFPNMTVEKNIAIVLKKGESPQTYIEQFYLQGLENHVPSMLSGGQKQRCALARMMAAKPEIILLDEPFSAVDRSLKWKLQIEILEVLKQQKNPVIFVSHNKEEVEHLCHMVAILDKGNLREFGNKEEIFEKPHTVAAAKLMGCENVFAYPSRKDGKGYTNIGIPKEAVSLTAIFNAADIKGRLIHVLGSEGKEIFVIRMTKECFYYKKKKEDKIPAIGDAIGLKIDLEKLWYLKE